MYLSLCGDVCTMDGDFPPRAWLEDFVAAAKKDDILNGFLHEFHFEEDNTYTLFFTDTTCVVVRFCAHDEGYTLPTAKISGFGTLAIENFDGPTAETIVRMIRVSLDRKKSGQRPSLSQTLLRLFEFLSDSGHDEDVIEELKAIIAAHV